METLVTSRNADGTAQIAPMGIWQTADHYVLAPFKPSRTLDNVLASRVVVLNFTDQVKVFAGCLTGRYDWPVTPATKIECFVLTAALTHVELTLDHVVEHELRPELHCKVVHDDFSKCCRTSDLLRRAYYFSIHVILRERHASLIDL